MNSCMWLCLKRVCLCLENVWLSLVVVWYGIKVSESDVGLGDEMV